LLLPFLPAEVDLLEMPWCVVGSLAMSAPAADGGDLVFQRGEPVWQVEAGAGRLFR
jgi:hypothetical protein